MARATLRTRFLMSLALISALLTSATLLLVRQRVLIHVRDEIDQTLRNAVVTFESLQKQRESTLETSAALLATLPPLKAVMTSQDEVTIQDASTTFWNLSGSQLLVLADRWGKVVAIHSAVAAFSGKEAQEAVRGSLARGESHVWWFGQGHLFEVFMQPIYFGSAETTAPMGLLAVGYDIGDQVAEDVSRVASSRVAFHYGKALAGSTLSAAQKAEMASRSGEFAARDPKPREIQLGAERFLMTTVGISSEPKPMVTLTVLKSFDEATAFLQSLNRWIVGVGIAGVLAGSLLVFFVSTTFTRPLAQLVGGVRALEEGNFAYPLKAGGGDEISTLTLAFQRMRSRLLETQQQLLDAERLATIGRMASMISHDLRHPLTAILAYAEFLSEGNLKEAQRKDFYQEIRIAVNRMTDEISSLLGFSKQRQALKLADGRFEDVIERAIHTVSVLPEFESLVITYTHEGECAGRFDPDQIERVMLNLLFNAGEAAPVGSGHIDVTSRTVEGGIEIRVADNGGGIPESIRDRLFQPFISYGKQHGIGLGLTAVQKIVRDHGGEVSVERTGPDGSVFKLFFPENPVVNTYSGQTRSLPFSE